MDYKLNQRVKTKEYGEGVIVNFEICDVRFKKCFYFDAYESGVRIGVKLDNPENWPLHSESSGIPYFLPSDLVEA